MFSLGLSDLIEEMSYPGLARRGTGSANAGLIKFSHFPGPAW